MCSSMHLAQGFKVTEKTESSGALEHMTLLDVCTFVESRYMLVLWVLQSFPGVWLQCRGLGLIFVPTSAPATPIRRFPFL